jgi:adenylate cyclase
MDFEAEGLLEGLEGDARDARERLLQDLVDDGVSLEEIHEACREDRLALLPVDRVLATDTPYTARDLADRTGVDLDALRAARGAFGLPIADDDERVYGDADLEVAANLKAVLDAGISLDNVVEMNRVIGRAVHQVAAASRAMVGDTVFRPGMTEYDLAKGSAAAARELAPRMGRTLEYVYGRHLRGLLRSEVVSATDIAAGRRGAREITVAFADLVGFTRIGEQVEAEQLGALSGRLEALASQHVEKPVTLVKVVGDAVMLVSPRGPDPLIDCALSLVARPTSWATTSRSCASASPAARRSSAPATGTAARSTRRAASPTSRGRAACSSPSRSSSTPTAGAGPSPATASSRASAR